MEQPSPSPKRAYDRKQIAVGCSIMLAILLFSCFVGYGIVHALVGANGGHAAALSTATTARPTAIPPTATPVSSITYAALGGIPAGFVAKYGPLQQGGYYYYHTLGSNLDVAIFPSQLATGLDHQKHFTIVQVAIPNDETWGFVNEQTICEFFLPEDAQQVGDVTVQLGAGLTADEWIYQSDELAATFPASLFVDSHHHVVSAGTFVIDYLPALGDLQPHCELSLGKS